MKFLLIIILTLITGLARRFPAYKELAPVDDPTIILGLLLISAFIFGKGAKRVNIPMLSGFILYGILAGPYVLNIITHRDVELLRFIDFFALSLIAITAGGELKVENIRKNLSLYVSITVGQFIFISGLTLLLIYLSSDLVPQLRGLPTPILIVIAGVISIISVANSPATAIAIIKELNAKGKNTDLFLGVAVFKDILIILVFAMFLSGAGSMLSGDQSVSILQTGFTISMHILYSILIGIGLGLVLIGGIKYVQENLSIIILLLSVFTFIFVQSLHLEAMLTCMVAGFVVQNFSRHGHDLIQNVEKSSMPFYIIFFTFAGVNLNFDILEKAWGIALVLVLFRMLMMFISTGISVHLVKGEKDTRKYLWLGYLSQAGVSLGLVAILQQTFDTPWAHELATILIAVIAINQILGPIALKYSLQKLKEI